MWQIIKHPITLSVHWLTCTYDSGNVAVVASGTCLLLILFEMMYITINNVHILQMTHSQSWAVLKYPWSSPICGYIYWRSLHVFALEAHSQRLHRMPSLTEADDVINAFFLPALHLLDYIFLQIFAHVQMLNPWLCMTKAFLSLLLQQIINNLLFNITIDDRNNSLSVMWQPTHQCSPVVVCACQWKYRGNDALTFTRRLKKCYL